jgi:L-asparaginase
MVQDISVYGTGAALQRVGIINGADMTTEAALTKLSYLSISIYNIRKIISSLRSNVNS